jgi:hypothetical protein
MNALPRLRDADPAFRLLITAFLLVLTSGYAVGIAFVGHTTGGGPKGITEQYRGTPEAEGAAELKYEKTPDEMYTLLHNHILSLSLVLFAVGGIFSFSSLAGPKLKAFLILEPFCAIATTFGGLWLVRFVAPGFGWLVLVSGISMGVCYFLMVVLILWELWRSPR